MTMNINTKQFIVGAVLAVSLVANAILIQQRFERLFYNRGLINGAEAVNGRLVKEVSAKGQIVVKMPNGQAVTLKSVQQPSPMLPANVVVPGTKNPQDVNQIGEP